MVKLKSIMSSFKCTVSAIAGLLFLVGCGAVSDTQPPQYVPAYFSEARVVFTSELNTQFANTNYAVETNTDNRDYHVWTIEELGDIIVATGMIWENWWSNGTFSSLMPDTYAPTPEYLPEHIPNSVYFATVSNSNFESLTDIRNYLLQFYTERWVDSVITQPFFPIIEYNGALYIHLARAGFSRPGWHTASHVLIAQVGNVAIVETTLYHGSWHRLNSGGDAFPFEMTHRFILIDGRIAITPGDVIYSLGDTAEELNIEQLRIEERFPHVSYLEEFIILDNGTLVDARLFEAWTVQNDASLNFNEEDLWYIFDLIIMHIKYINDGDRYGLLSTMMGQDASDSNHFHPQIFAFMNEHKNSGLFVERILLSSIGSGIRIVVSNSQGEEFHIWPLLNTNWEFIREINAYGSTLRINRYVNNLSKEYWVNEHSHLLEYILPFHVFGQPSLDENWQNSYASWLRFYAGVIIGAKRTKPVNTGVLPIQSQIEYRNKS